MRLIISTMKDEGPFILEWIAYYQSIGFTHFLINSNDCSDQTDEILNRLQELGIVAHIDNPGPWPKGPQASAYANAQAHPWYKAAEWIFVCDADEFLDIKVGDGTLDALFAAAPQANAFSFVWLLFGHGGVEKFEDKFVIEQFYKSANPRQIAPEQCRAFKTLYRNNGIFKVVDTHRPRAPYPRRCKEIRWVDADGIDMGSKFLYYGWNFSTDGVGFGDKFGRLNHYAIRSVETYLIKRLRGDVNISTLHNNKNDGAGQNYLKLHCWDSVESKSISRMISTVRERFTELLDDKILRYLHKNACDIHQARIVKLREDSAVRVLIEEFIEFTADSSETRLIDCAVSSSEVIQSKSKFLTFSPIKKINNIRKIQDSHIETAQKLMSKSLKDTARNFHKSSGESYVATESNVVHESTKQGQRDFLVKPAKEIIELNNEQLQYYQNAFSNLKKPDKLLVIGMQNPNRIAELLEVVGAGWMGVLASWGNHLVDQRKWANTDYHLKRARLFDGDQKFTNTLGSFVKEIRNQRLSFFRAQSHLCLRLFEQDSLDIIYYHGRFRTAPFLMSLEEAFVRLRPGGHLIFDSYRKLTENTSQNRSMSKEIHQFLSNYSSELRIEKISGSFIRIQKLTTV